MGENDQIPVDPDFAGECFKEGCVKSSRQWLYAVLILLVGLFVPKHANAQAVRFDTTVDTTSSTCVSGKQCPLLVIPGATVSVCGGSVTTLSSCLASPATTYTDYTAGTPCATTAQLTPATGGACLSTADAQGGAGFWALPGQYNYFLRVPATAGGGTYGPYPINVGASAGCPSGSTCDANFSTLPAACTAAGTGTLYLTRTWSGLTTQTLACNIQALANGIIRPASGQTVTLTGAFGGDLTQHFDTSSGGAVSLRGSTPEVYAEWFGAATYTYASGVSGAADNCQAFTAAASALQTGGILRFANAALGKAYYSSCAITQTLPAHYRGAGRGDDCSNSPTCIVFAAGVNGIVNTNTSRGSSVEDLFLKSLDTGANSDNGLTIGDSYFYGHNVGIKSFGNAGVYSLNNNVDFMHLNQVAAYANYGDGFYCYSSDCGEMVWENLHSQGNHGIGFNGKFGHSIFLTDVSELDVTGSWNIIGLSNYFISPYCEGTANTFTLGGNYNQVLDQFAASCVITNNGGVSNFITLSGLYNNQLRVTGVNPQTANNEYYALYSGVDAPGCFSLRDEGTVPGTSPSFSIMKYCPGSTPVLSFPTVQPSFTNVNAGSYNYVGTETSGSANNAIKVTSNAPFGNGTELTILLSHTLAGGSSTNTLQCICNGVDSTALTIRSHFSIFNGITTGYGGGGAVSVLHVIYTGNGSWFDMSQ